MNAPLTVTTFYQFTDVRDPQALRAPLLTRMRELGVRGTITLAGEGINATVSGTQSATQALLEFLQTHLNLRVSMQRESQFAAQPFQRSKVKVKRELISLGVPSFPAQCVGHYVQPKEWNALITSPGVITIDTRNQYEFTLGHFEGAVNPATRNFKQMVKWTEENLPPPTETLKERFDSPARGELHSQPRIAMYCTGGIRCEKYSSYLVARGFAEVYHLEGGILAYLEQIPESASLWRGNCFVFDERVAVGHGLVPANVPAPAQEG
jgi:UPF0176 protein